LSTPPLVIDQGAIELDGVDLLKLNRASLDEIRGNSLSMIFQDPNSALNPLFTIGEQMAAILSRHRSTERGGRRQSKVEDREKSEDMLNQMRLAEPSRVMKSFPYELSGGMKQRVLIAMAMLNEPKLIVADEPGSALDVTVQDQILELLESHVKERHLSLMFITHNLGVARRISDRVAIMYAGEVVEVASTEKIFEEPAHPYTQGLLKAIPTLSGGKTVGIAGSMPEIANRPPGCPFHPRCPHRMVKCETEVPLLTMREGRMAACHLYRPDNLLAQEVGVGA
jgi:oligopeptide/dipeptide ABC transporter ATP-binding protein